MAAETLRWKDGHLTIIDQNLLPLELRYIELRTLEEVWNAIKELKVRGAPAIGVCAAFGVLVGLKERRPANVQEGLEVVCDARQYLGTARPTAVNLFWALNRMAAVAEDSAAHADESSDIPGFEAALEAEAVRILEQDRQRCQAIGAHGAALIRDGDGVLTHCNAGGLATSAYGTALAVMYAAHEAGRRFHVFADETRPLLQGARLTAWELMSAGIDVTLICDNTAAQVMREGKVQLVIVGADRIAANGDTANKIGTYSVALLAKAHEIPFYVAAPFSTFDLELESGDAIPIEYRDPREVTHGFGQATAPNGVQVYNPAFDVTPANLIAGLITEHGILSPPFQEPIRRFAGETAGLVER